MAASSFMIGTFAHSFGGKRRLLPCALFLTCALAAPAFAQTPRVPGVPHRDDEREGASREEAIRRYEKLLSDPSPALKGRRTEFSYRLGVLYLESGVAGKPGRPSTEQAFDRAIELFREVLDEGKSAFREDALYSLGVAHEETGRTGEAVRLYRRVLDEYPGTRRAPELWFRIAGAAVRENRLRDALEAYERVLSAGASAYRPSATYMLSWVASSLHEPARARTLLTDLLTRLERKERTGAELYEEAVDLLAEIVVTEKRPEQILSHREHTFTRAVLRRAGDLFQETGAWSEAARSWELVRQLTPSDARTGELDRRILEAHRRAGNEEPVEATRRRLIDRHVRDGRIEGASVEEIAPIVLDSAIYRHRHSRDGAGESSLREAIILYQTFLENAPDQPGYWKALHLQAEALREIGNPRAAAERYARVAAAGGGPGEGEDAAFRRIAAVEELLARDQAEPSDLTDAYEDYLDRYADSTRATDLRVRLTQHLFDQNRYDQAVEAGDRALAAVTDPDIRARLLSLVSRAAFEAGTYPVAARRAETLLEEKELSPERRAAAREIHAAALFRLAGEREKEPAEAARHYERIARQHPDHESAPAALFNAAMRWREAGDAPAAAEAVKLLVTEHPASDLVPEAVTAVAASLRENGRRREASELLTTAARHRQGSEAADWLYRAARDAERAGDRERQVKILERFVTAHPGSGERTVTALSRLATAHLQADREDEAERAALTAIGRAPAGTGTSSDAVQLAVAEAQYTLGEIGLRRFERIRLDESVEKSLERKRNALQTCLEHFRSAAEFGFADVSLASTYKIGYAQARFAEALLQAPRPKGLSPDERKQYDTLLAEQVAPYRERAAQAFRSTLEQAQAADVENEWTTRAREALKGASSRS